jgi:hypothetical protein
MKNKILIFFSANVYPRGGMKDLIGEANSLEEAESVIIKLLLKNDDIDGLVCWWQLVNKENLQIIKCSEDE